LEKEAVDKELEAKEVETKETITKEGKDTIENINCVDVINKEELLLEHGGENCFIGIQNLVDSSSNDDDELSDLVLTNLNMIELPAKAISADGEPVRDSFKIWKPGKWIFKFPHAVHKSIFQEIKMVWYGKSRVTSNNVLKIVFLEFCAKLLNGVDTLKDHQQNRVWNPGGIKSFRLVAVTLLQKSDIPHRHDSIIFLIH